MFRLEESAWVVKEQCILSEITVHVGGQNVFNLAYMPITDHGTHRINCADAMSSTNQFINISY